MTSRPVRRLIGGAILCVLATPMLVVGDGRKNPRDFPAQTLCPVNLGWLVDPDLGTLVEPRTVRPPALTFVAAGGDAEISLVSCDRGLLDDHPDGLDLWVRDFAVVRKDVYDSHQAASTDPGQECYQNNGGEADFFRTVGSTFDPNVAPAVKPQSLKFPFFDDFSDLAFSRKKWQLDGAEFKIVGLSDPSRDPAAFDATALVLARVPSAGQNACSRASVRVRNLKKDQTYVIDFKWESQGMLGAPEIEMLTFVDTDPK